MLRRAEAGEEITIRLAGGEIARLVRAGRRQRAGGGPLQAVWRTPTPRTLAAHVEQYPSTIMDPFA